MDTYIDIDDIGLFRASRDGGPSQYDKARAMCDQFSECMDNALSWGLFSECGCTMPYFCSTGQPMDCIHLKVDFADLGAVPTNRIAQLESRMRELGSRVAAACGDAGSSHVHDAQDAVEAANVAAQFQPKPGSPASAKPKSKSWFGLRWE